MDDQSWRVALDLTWIQSDVSILRSELISAARQRRNDIDALRTELSAESRSDIARLRAEIHSLREELWKRDGVAIRQEIARTEALTRSTKTACWVFFLGVLYVIAIYAAARHPKVADGPERPISSPAAHS